MVSLRFGFIRVRQLTVAAPDLFTNESTELLGEKNDFTNPALPTCQFQSCGAQHAVTSPELPKREQSNRSWDATCHNPGTGLLRTGWRSADRQLVVRTCRTSACTPRTSKSCPEAALPCTRDKQTRRDAATLPGATTLSTVLVLPSNSAR